MSQQIAEQEAERGRLTHELQALQRRLAALSESVAKKREARDEYDRVVEQTEAAYNKIQESSQTLLHVLRREASAIDKRRGGGGGGAGAAAASCPGGYVYAPGGAKMPPPPMSSSPGGY
jgi:Sjoegren syndrome nuclear autoantigen 1